MKTIKIGNFEVRWEIPVIVISALVIAITLGVKCSGGGKAKATPIEEVVPVEYLYGFDRSQYDIYEGKVEEGQTLSHILEGYTSQVNINRIAAESKQTYDFRHMKVGDEYAIFSQSDSLGSHLRHFVFEKNRVNVVYVSLDAENNISVKMEQKEQRFVRRKVTAKISSSLWNCLIENDIHPALAIDIEDIYGWSVDFFALHEGDTFTAIFDERYIEDERVGTGTVWGCVFNHAGKDYYAIPFDQNGKLSYWDENGKSMRKQFLKAPLKYTRISSKFSYNRMHPVHKVRRPHLGVDYAAPMGTPVVAIADGTITARYWDKKGGGNVLKIKHTNGYSSSYLHLKGYAKGIAVGKRVSQGQLIAYVGSTGTSTGAHLDFRLYKNGKPMDPLKAPSDPVEPIKKANEEAFGEIKAKVLAELAGDVAPEDMVTNYDLYPSTRPVVTLTAQDSLQMKVRGGAMWKALNEIE